MGIIFLHKHKLLWVENIISLQYKDYYNILIHLQATWISTHTSIYNERHGGGGWGCCPIAPTLPHCSCLIKINSQRKKQKQKKPHVKNSFPKQTCNIKIWENKIDKVGKRLQVQNLALV